MKYKMKQNRVQWNLASDSTLNLTNFHFVVVMNPIKHKVRKTINRGVID